MRKKRGNGFLRTRTEIAAVVGLVACVIHGARDARGGIEGIRGDGEGVKAVFQLWDVEL